MQDAVSKNDKKRDSISPDTTTYVTQSRYFSPVFNAAIFDGPIRIYFAQFQEAQALKLYFNLQERFSDVRKNARGIFKERGQNIFVMMYPNEDTFEHSFGEDSETDPAPTGSGAEAGVISAGIGSFSGMGTSIIRTRLGRDFVVGVRGPVDDADLESVCREMDQIVSSPLAI